MNLKISEQQAQTLLSVLEDRKSSLATRALILPGHYHLQGKMAQEMRTLDDIIDTLKTTIQTPWK